ncbi:lysophospholipid acyltransferase family protein [Roseibium sp. SCP14]|uniref:lysophospholipid acyltransferase family protein n=1 Tax=Roseibium sp. SCP14 TaxID=3141375 RepID=UPI003337D2F0
MNKPFKLEDIPFEETLAEEPELPPIRDILARDPSSRKTAYIHWFRHTIDGVLNTIFHTGLRYCPDWFVSEFGRALVPLARWSYRNKIFPSRIERNFAALTQGSWQHRIQEQHGLNRWWQNIGRTISEFCVVNDLWRKSRISVEGIENIESARRSGRPLIFTSMHLGTWEALFVAIHDGLARPSIGPFQPEPNRFKNRIVHAIRRKREQYLFPPGQRSAYRLHRLMKTGRYSMTIFIDEVRNKQVHLPLFGRKAPDRGNAVVATKIANACDGVLVPTYLKRTGPARFKMVVLPPIQGQDATASYDVSKTVMALNDVFEPIVLNHIDEWYMLGELRLPKNFEQGTYAKSLAAKNTERRLKEASTP